jgi:hypothetical protein
MFFVRKTNLLNWAQLWNIKNFLHTLIVERKFDLELLKDMSFFNVSVEETEEVLKKIVKFLTYIAW